MLFDFNYYSSLLLPAFVNALVFIVLFANRGFKESSSSDFLAALILMVLSFKILYWMLGFAGWYDSHDGYTMFMFYFPFNLLMFVGPALYYYFLSVTNAEFQWKKSDLKHWILPALVLVMYISKAAIDFSMYYPFDNDPSTQYGSKGPYAEVDKTVVFAIVSYCSFFYYLWLTHDAYTKFKAYLSNHFSSTAYIDFSWLKNMIVALGTGIFIFFAINFYSYYFVEGKSFMFEWNGYFAIGLLSYYFSISAYSYSPDKLKKLHFEAEIEANNSLYFETNEPLEEDAPTLLDEDAKPSSSNATTIDIEHWKEKLLYEMVTKQAFLNPEITLSELAKTMKTNNSLLSKVINDGFGQNFNDFINAYRVATIKQKIDNNEHKVKTLLSLAYESGFNSKATFNRSFKKITGLAPKDYGG
jgi:AraC-like DNA-binding protein